MFLNGLLFGVGWIVGAGVMVLSGFGILALRDWFANRGRKRFAQDDAAEDIHCEIVSHAECAILRLEKLLSLTQNLDGRRVPTKSATRQTFTIQ